MRNIPWAIVAIFILDNQCLFYRISTTQDTKLREACVFLIQSASISRYWYCGEKDGWPFLSDRFCKIEIGCSSTTSAINTTT